MSSSAPLFPSTRGHSGEGYGADRGGGAEGSERRSPSNGSRFIHGVTLPRAQGSPLAWGRSLETVVTMSLGDAPSFFTGRRSPSRNLIDPTRRRRSPTATAEQLIPNTQKARNAPLTMAIPHAPLPAERAAEGGHNGTRSRAGSAASIPRRAGADDPGVRSRSSHRRRVASIE